MGFLGLSLSLVYIAFGISAIIVASTNNFVWCHGYAPPRFSSTPTQVLLGFGITFLLFGILICSSVTVLIIRIYVKKRSLQEVVKDESLKSSETSIKEVLSDQNQVTPNSLSGTEEFEEVFSRTIDLIFNRISYVLLLLSSVACFISSIIIGIVILANSDDYCLNNYFSVNIMLIMMISMTLPMFFISILSSIAYMLDIYTCNCDKKTSVS